MKSTLMTMVAAGALCLFAQDAIARGGGRGGGGHMGGGGGGGARMGGSGGHMGGGGMGGGARSSINHSPSFSSPHGGGGGGGFSHSSGSGNFNRQTAGAGNRPAGGTGSEGNRANFGGGGSGGNFAGGNRSGFENRSNFGNTANIGNRANIGNTANIGNRANIGNTANIGNRANIGNTANFGNRANIGNTANIGNRANFSNNNFNRNNFNNFDHNFVNHNGWYHGNWHGNWNHGWYNRPGWWGAGLATGLAISAIPWGWGYYSYYNPYAVAPVTYQNTTIDYSQPILANGQDMSQAPPVDQFAAGQPPPGDQPAPSAQPTLADQATDVFEQARASFMQGDYQAAINQVNQAIALVPNDTALHEFRGLVLFATGQYKDAAGVIYAVLSAGPGWDWTTLSSLYPNAEVYTEQLRALEAFCKQNPNSAEGRFLLAYEYMTCGSSDAAAAQLKEVVLLNPKDQLSAQLLASLTTVPGQEPPATTPAAPATPVSASSLAGKWKAQRPDGGSITLDLSKDAKFTWNFTQQDKSQAFSGDYNVADNLLVLNKDNNPAMVGQVRPLSDRSFNFKLAGAPPADPGLTFTRS